MTDEKDFPEVKPWTYGRIRQRRRESAILISSWRLARRGVSHIRRLHPTRLSQPREKQPQCTEPPFTRNENDHCVVQQRIERSTLVVQAHGPEARRGEEETKQVLLAKVGL